MRDRSQLLKGILEGCILKIISKEETYGYEIVEKLRAYGFKDCTEGTIYPLLLRLEKNGYLLHTKKASPFGPKRKYYSLSDGGNEELRLFKEDWTDVRNSVANIFKGD